MNYQIIYRGLFHDSQGYAQACRNYALALANLGVDIVFQPIKGYTKPIKLERNIYLKIRELSNKKINNNKKKVLIHHLQPNMPIHQEKDKYDKIIVNTVYEPDRVPSNWVNIINKIDQLWIPSTHCYNIFKNSGVKVPINIFHHGVSDIYKPSNETINFYDFNDCFKFLSIGTWSYRKAPEKLLEAYWKEFSINDNVVLIFKTKPASNIMELKKQIIGNKETAKIIFIPEQMEEKDIVNLYNTSDCFVLPTRGEGVGLPFMEAMSCEKPCIATNWSGHLDFINNKNGYLIDYELQEVDLNNLDAGYSFEKNMKFAEPDVNSLREKMRYAYENQVETKEKGIISRQDIKKFNWEQTAKYMKKELDRLVR